MLIKIIWGFKDYNKMFLSSLIVPSDACVCSSFRACSSSVVCSLYLESPWKIFLIMKTTIKNYQVQSSFQVGTGGLIW